MPQARRVKTGPPGPRRVAPFLSVAILLTLIPSRYGHGEQSQPALDALVRQLGSPVSREQQQAQSALIAVGPDAAPALLRGLDSDSPGVRAGSARVLGKLSVMAARPRLIDLLKDPDFHVRWMALDALANLRHPDDVPTFERYFLGTEDAMGTPRESNQDVQVLALRRTAATGLYRTGGPKAVEILQRGLSDPEPILRRTCAFGLGMLKERQAVPAILKALDDEDAGVREKADLALQQISGRRVGFDPHGLPLKREIGKTKWQAWWESAAKEPAP